MILRSTPWIELRLSTTWFTNSLPLSLTMMAGVPKVVNTFHSVSAIVVISLSAMGSAMGNLDSASTQSKMYFSGGWCSVGGSSSRSMWMRSKTPFGIGMALAGWWMTAWALSLWHIRHVWITRAMSSSMPTQLNPKDSIQERVFHVPR